MDHDNLMLTAPTNGIWAAPNAMLLQGPDIAQNHVNALLLHTYLMLTYQPQVHLDQPPQVSEPNHHFHEPLIPRPKLSKVKSIPPLHVLQSVMPECQCVYVVVQDPTFVICTSHKGLGLLLRADIEGLVVDSLEAAFHYCISTLLCLKDTLVQLDVLHAHPLSINHHIARNSLCCVVYHMLLINQDSTSSV